MKSSNPASAATRARWRLVAGRSLVVLACVSALAGCSTVRGWFGGGDSEKAAAKRASEPAELVDFTPSATVSRLWSANAGKGEDRLGVRQAPAIADGRVYAAAVEGGVRAFDLQTGALLWHYRSDLRLTGGPGAGDGLVVVGSLKGDVVALDAATGAERWQAKVPNEVIAAPVIGQGLVFVRSNDGRVTAFDVNDGQRRWFWTKELPSLTVRGNDAPVLGPGVMFVGNDDGTIAAVSVADGRELWDLPVAQPDGRTELDRMADVDGTPVLDGTVLYASSYKQSTVALDAPSGRPIWASEHGGPGRPGLAIDKVVVSDRNGSVWGLDRSSGGAVWEQPGLARRNLSGVAVHGDYAVVGDFEGYLHWLRLDNGDFAARQRAGRAAIKGPPVVADGILVVQNVDGGLTAWRVQ
ncbi:Beta-barrel assembly machine subunit BamB [Luteimonas sp. J16]|jgi:outer membrane protein assembly factor BamB|uniref:outer membrane protein assembly factor BamB n=1 Tax=unclassified Luteimonas TaxID=2629088 RepID=UPI0004ADD181|nr:MULTISPECIES: outer membrane protein assembly factor BamB [unclassified Luteimonas]TWG92553.1 Beta-barrel assembly machine subunit BamB [Luteimonas sp. J16]